MSVKWHLEAGGNGSFGGLVFTSCSRHKSECSSFNRPNALTSLLQLNPSPINSPNLSPRLATSKIAIAATPLSDVSFLEVSVDVRGDVKCTEQGMVSHCSVKKTCLSLSDGGVIVMAKVVW